MSKHQVFLIHGMGKFDAGWSGALKEEIRKSFGAYKKLDASGFVDSIDFVEIVYDDIFEEWRKMWKDDAAAAADALTKLNSSSASVAKRLVELAQAPTGDSFFQTHVLDVALYRYMKQFREQVNQTLCKKILERLNAFPGGQVPQWSAIAHSLGTSVLHNTLQEMFTQPVDGVLLGDAYMPAYLFMVANVSKVLWSLGGDFYSSVVRPHPAETKGLCWKYGNFRHMLDPFPAVDPFDPPDRWFPEHYDPDRLYANVELPKDDIQDLNVHGLSHYWSHPLVHVEIINTLTDDPMLIEDQEVKAALKKWRDDRVSPAKLKAYQAQLKQYLGLDTSKWEGVVEAIVKFRAAVLENGLDPREGESTS
jgi:hypothetical protein